MEISYVYHYTFKYEKYVFMIYVLKISAVIPLFSEFALNFQDLSVAFLLYINLKCS